MRSPSKLRRSKDLPLLSQRPVRATARMNFESKQHVLSYFGLEKITMREYINDVMQTCNDKIAKIEHRLPFLSKNISEKAYPEFIKILGELESVTRSGPMWKITKTYFKSFCISLFEVSEFQQLISSLKKFLTRSKLKKDARSLLFCYEHLGTVHSKIKMFHRSLQYYFKTLKIALKLRDYKKELELYDRIGMTYFNINNIEKAEYFHLRMLEARLEPDDSNIRSVPLPKVRKVVMIQQNKELDSDTEDEVSDLYYEPMKQNSKILESIALKFGHNEFYIPGDSKKNETNRNIGNVRVFGRGSQTERIKYAQKYNKPTPLIKSTLTHMSTNRALDNHNSNCKIPGPKEYRFSKYFAAVSPKSYGKMMTAFIAFSDEVKIARRYLDRLKSIVNKDDKEYGEHSALPFLKESASISTLKISRSRNISLKDSQGLVGLSPRRLRYY